MEKLRPTLILLTISYIVMANPTAHADKFPDNDAKILWFGKENLPTLHFYGHNIASGPNATAFLVASASITPDSPTGFGKVFILDDKLTIGPEPDSAEVGRLQGITASVGMQTLTYLQDFSFFFTSGKYNGSVLFLFARKQVEAEHRELVVVGGAGLFRYARGYVSSTNYLHDVVADRLVLEYRVYLTYNKMVE